MLGEAGGVDGGARDDHLEVGALRQQLPQVPEDEVDVEAAFVGLVDDQRVVTAQHPVALDLGEQDAVGHHFDERGVADLVGEADGVADVVAELRPDLLGDPFGDRARRDPAGLGVTDHPVDAATCLEAQLRQLGALSRAGLAGDDHDLMVTNRVEDLVSPLGDRERVRIREPTLDRLRRNSAWMLGRFGGRVGHGLPARQASHLPPPSPPRDSRGTPHPLR